MSNHSSINTAGDLNYSPAEGFISNYKKYPEKTALVLKGSAYSYQQLMDHAYAIYQRISKNGKHDRIAVYCSDNVFSYAAILAVSMYGACYVPLNPGFPVERNAQFVSESKATLILSEEELRFFQDKPGIPEVVFGFEPEQQDAPILITRRTEQSLAYILFTSGTTGIPKGVPVSKNNLYHFFSYFLSEYDFGTHDGFLQPYEFTFDVSVFSMFMPWQLGACCYAVPQNGIRYLDIVEVLKKYPVSVTSMVPGVLRFLEKYIDELNFPSIRYSFFSGDALSHKLAAKWKTALPNGEIHNFYGPTETTIVCARYKWSEHEAAEESVHDIVPLGHVFPGMKTLICDESGKLIENGAIGELCLSGAQVIGHYLGMVQPEAFFTCLDQTWYRTGDLVSINKKGNLVFHGRKDKQVKINGYRVELAEIEEKLKELSGRNCSVICLKDHAEINYLAAVIEGTTTDQHSIKNKLSAVLPQYMIPKHIFFIEKLPSNMNGKLDLQQLKQWLNEQSYIA